MSDGVLTASTIRRDAIEAWFATLRPGMTVALSTHINSDGDGCGSETALARLLAQRGIHARIVNPTPWPVMFNFLLGDDIEEASARGAAALDGIDALIVLDINDIRRLGHLADTVRSLTVPISVIDHHVAGDEPVGHIAVADNTACATGELVFDNVKVPKENLLPNKSGLGAPLGCLDSARYGIAWGALGAAMDCYDTALRYSKERVQFDRPIGGFQLQQKKLAEMITEITKAQLLTLRLGQLKNEGRATTGQISMAKRNNVNMALEIAREARQMLGGMGITGDYPIMRHMMNLESVVTYEGTHDIHLLITGMDVTGLSAFK